MTKIIYRPHCSKCGAIINEKVSYQEIISDDFPYHLINAAMNPSKCECCGEYFIGIQIDLPVESEDKR